MHTNNTKCPKTSLYSTMGWIVCVHCEKFGHDFMARTFTLVRPILHRVQATKRPECTQIERNTPKRQFRVQWGGLGAFVQKIPTRFRGTNFCTSSARFAPSFFRQPNGPECTQIVRNTPKHQFIVQRGWIGCVRSEKFGCDFVARTFALVRRVLHRDL